MPSYWNKLFSNGSIWPIDGTLTGTTTPGQSGSESNDNEVVFHTCLNSKTGAWPWEAVLCPTLHTLFGEG